MLSIIGDMFGGGDDDGSGGGGDGLMGDGNLSGSSSGGGLMPDSSADGGMGGGGGDDLLGGGGGDDMMGGGGGMGGGDMMGGGDDMMGGGGGMGGGGDMSFDQMDDGDGGEGGASSEIESRVEEMENDIGSLSSTVNTVQSENEKIGESLEDIEENIRKLLEVYEMVTQGVNPFVEGDSLSESFDDGSGGAQGTGNFGDNSLFDGDEDEDEADVDEDISAADAEDFLDDDVIEDDSEDGFGDEFEADAESDMDTDGGSADDLSFDELKDEYDSGAANWDGDDQGDGSDDLAGAETDVDTDPDSTDANTAADIFETDEEQPADSRPDSSGSPPGSGMENAWNDGGRPYLQSLPSEYDTEFLVMEWLDYLVDEVGLDGAAETVRFYGSIHWVDDPVEEYLQTMLNGFGGGPDVDDPQPNSSLGIDHRRSLWWISQVASPKKKQLTFGEWVREEDISASRLETELAVDSLEERETDAEAEPELDDEAEPELETEPELEAELEAEPDSEGTIEALEAGSPELEESASSVESAAAVNADADRHGAEDAGTELTFVSYIGVENDDGSMVPASSGWVIDDDAESRQSGDRNSSEHGADEAPTVARSSETDPERAETPTVEETADDGTAAGPVEGGFENDIEWEQSEPTEQNAEWQAADPSENGIEWEQSESTDQNAEWEQSEPVEQEPEREQSEPTEGGVDWNEKETTEGGLDWVDVDEDSSESDDTDDPDVSEDGQDDDTDDTDGMDWIADSDDESSEEDDPEDLWGESEDDGDDGFWDPSGESGNESETTGPNETRTHNASETIPQGVNTDGGRTMWSEADDSSSPADGSWETHRDVMLEAHDDVLVSEETTETEQQ